MELSELQVYREVQLPVDASYACSRITVEQLLALRPGSLVLTEQEPGENVDVRTGQVLLGKAELCSRGDAMIARFVVMAENVK